MKVSCLAVLELDDDGTASPAAGIKESARAAVSKDSIGLIKRAA